MHLYIDANIYLDFFHLTSTDIEELKKLVELIKSEDVVLYMPEQTCNEIDRNRDSKINESIEIFKKTANNFSITFPAFAKSFDEYAEMRILLKDIRKKHSSLLEKVRYTALQGEFEADEIIKQLLDVSKILNTDDDIFDMAMERFYKGNPPGKNKGSMGDEINWESLLHAVPEGNDLYIVSKDKDYASVFNNNRANSYLKKEWALLKKSNLFLYNNLTDFFNEKYPDIKFAADVSTRRLITRLSSSGTFATTHTVISSLNGVDVFSSSQVEELIDIANENSQVRWIFGDSNIKQFYLKLKNNFYKSVSEAHLKSLDELFNSVDAHMNAEEEEEEEEEDIPF